MRAILFLLFTALLVSGCIEPVTRLDEKRYAEAQQEMLYFYRDLDPAIPLELSLQEAIDVALERNLDLLVNAQQAEVQRETFTKQTLAMLPSVIAHGLWSYRTAGTGAFSKSLVPNIPPAPPSVSSSQTTRLWDVTCTWKLLDFCIAYFRSTQETNRVLALQFDYERAAQNLILNVVHLYWKLAAEIEIERQAAIAGPMVDSVKERVAAMIDRRIIGPESGSNFLAQLISFQIQLADYHKVYHQTLSEFRGLLGLPPGVEIELIDAARAVESPICLSPCQELEELALVNRPELYSKDIQDVILSDEIHVALIQLFPDVSGFIAPNYDGNPFLIFNHWMNVGVNAAWNLLALPYHLQEGNVAHQQKKLNHYNRLAIALGVISQVQLSCALYDDDVRRFHDAEEFWKAREESLKVAEARRRLNNLGDLEYVATYMNAYIAEVELRRVLVDVYSSLEQLNNSIGLPLHYGYMSTANEETCDDEV